MTGRVSVVECSQNPPMLGAAAGRLQAAGLVLALVGLVGGFLAAGDSQRYLHAYFVGFIYVLTIVTGGLFFVLMQFTTRAGWSVAVRRVSEGVAALYPLLALLAIPIALFAGRIYPWISELDDPVIAGRGVWFRVGFFQCRLVGYLVVLSAVGWYFLSRSTAQDATGDPSITLRLERRAAPLTVLYAVVVSLAAFDFMMSLEPHWFSTIFGVYVFASSFVSFLAAFPILVWLLSRGVMKRAVSKEHYHDMGKFLFAFIVFWAYIAFSQYLLIWYGNLPEETSWYLRRQSGSYLYLGVALLVGHFIIPFVALIGRGLKRRPKMLVGMAVYMMVMHLLDIGYLLVPDLSPNEFQLGLPELLTTLGMVGISFFFLVLLLRRRSLMPLNDPRLCESLAFENV